MSVAASIGLRSQCDGRKIGAAIVSPDNAYVVVGYNGPPATMAVTPWSSCRTWCPRMLSGERSLDYGNCTSVHAEANALIKADRSRIEGASLYVTSSCCWDCGKMVANSGIKRVVMNLDEEADAHREPNRTIAFMSQCGLDVRIFSV
jgi:dCMP deaminase